jgi:hypothetical protein
VLGCVEGNKDTDILKVRASIDGLSGEAPST